MIVQSLFIRLFQFHKGTIRTWSQSNAIKAAPVFQFHKGTIRTHLMVLIFLVLLHFNSIKVQLEQNNDCVAYVPPIFQFHKGTIRTALCYIYWLCCYISIP